MGDAWPALRGVFTYKNLVHAVAGATGSSVAITVFYPLDTVRTRLQVDDGRKATFSLETILDIFEEEGFAGLYRGWFPVVTSICCSNFVYFYAYNSLKAIAYSKKAQPNAAKDLLLAFLSGVTNVLLTTPLWVANTRLKLQGIKWRQKVEDIEYWEQPEYKGLIDALLTIISQEGLFALWSGTVPSLFLATNPAVQFMVYEALKRNVRQNPKNMGGFAFFMMGAIAKTVSTLATYPIQVIQARLRAGKDRQGRGLRGMYQTLKQIAEERGAKGLYKGLEAKLTQTVLMAALMFLTYEKIAAFVFRIMRAQATLNAKPV